MESTVKNLITKLISYPEELDINIVDENNFTTVEIKANDTDTAKIIGKHGLTIKALGDLLFIYQQKNQSHPYQRIILKVI